MHRIRFIQHGAVLLALALPTMARAALPAAPHACTLVCAPARDSRACSSDGATPAVIAAPASAACIREALEQAMAVNACASSTPPPPPPGKSPHHDPMFPSAFVFQSNSALFLAIEVESEAADFRFVVD